jgi:hypothetical protein
VLKIEVDLFGLEVFVVATVGTSNGDRGPPFDMATAGAAVLVNPTGMGLASLANGVLVPLAPSPSDKPSMGNPSKRIEGPVALVGVGS